MSNLSHEEVASLSRLCRIECTPKELESFSKDLAQILTYIEQLDKIDTTGVEACDHVINLVNVFREDEEQELLARDIFLANAPAQVSGMVKVPPVFKK